MDSTKLKAWQHSTLDRNQTQRFKKLGDLGEDIAEKLLRENGFTKVLNLNNTMKNSKFADLSATKGNDSLIFSVKTRNKYENTGKLNSRYKLGAKCYELADQAEKRHNAKAAWIAIAIRIDKGIFDAYWGFLSELRPNKGIPMSPKATANYRCLAAKTRFEDLGITENQYINLKNVYRPRS